MSTFKIHIMIGLWFKILKGHLTGYGQHDYNLVSYIS